MEKTPRDFLKNQIYLGTSSWKYPGWKGLVYKETYGSEKRFNDTCLIEYAKTYPCVGVDHTFYAWPLPKTFDKYAEQTPADFKMGLKVTDEITVTKFPKQPRYGKRSGQENPGFLDAGLFREKFLEPISKHKDRIGPIMLEFSQFFPGTISSGHEFCNTLSRFFSELKNVTDFKFAVEMRNANWLKPLYFETLIKYNVTHVFNSWTRMPSIGEQLALAQNYKFTDYICRILLKPGRDYEDAVEKFSPYDRIQEEQLTTRDEVAKLAIRAMDLGVPAYVYVNNRFEGCAPLTLLGIMDRIENLKKDHGGD